MIDSVEVCRTSALRGSYFGLLQCTYAYSCPTLNPCIKVQDFGHQTHQVHHMHPQGSRSHQTGLPMVRQWYLYGQKNGTQSRTSPPWLGGLMADVSTGIWRASNDGSSLQRWCWFWPLVFVLGIESEDERLGWCWDWRV